MAKIYEAINGDEHLYYTEDEFNEQVNDYIEELVNDEITCDLHAFDHFIQYNDLHDDWEDFLKEYNIDSKNVSAMDRKEFISDNHIFNFVACSAFCCEIIHILHIKDDGNFTISVYSSY